MNKKKRGKKKLLVDAGSDVVSVALTEGDMSPGELGAGRGGRGERGGRVLPRSAQSGEDCEGQSGDRYTATANPAAAALSWEHKAGRPNTGEIVSVAQRRQPPGSRQNDQSIYGISLSWPPGGRGR